MDFYLGLLQIIGVHTLLGPLGLRGAADRAGEPRAGRLHGDRRLRRGHADRARQVGAGAGAAGGRLGGGGGRLPGRLPGAQGARPDAGGGDAGVRRGGAPVLLQLRLSDRHGRHQSRPARRRGLPPDPLLPRERLDHVPGDGVHLADRGRRDGGAVVDGPLARRRRAAGGRRGRGGRAELRHQPHRGEGARP